MLHEQKLKNLNAALAAYSKLRIEPIKVPKAPLGFFQEHIGAIKHPKLKTPSQPFGYQYKCSFPYVKHAIKLLIKSHKIGMSTWFIIEDLWKAYYECAGQEIIVTAQKYALAKDHLRDIRRFLYSSPSLAPTVIYSGKRQMQDEKTKIETVYLQSPLSNEPTRIMAVPFSVTSLESWKNVGHVHASDVAVNNYRDDSEVFGAMFSRVANTGGSITIETIPGGQRRTVYSLWRDDPSIWKKTLPYDVGVQAGLITEDFIEEERKRWGPLFPALYEGVFLAAMNAAYPEKLIESSITNEEDEFW